MKKKMSGSLVVYHGANGDTTGKIINCEAGGINIRYTDCNGNTAMMWVPIGTYEVMD